MIAYHLNRAVTICTLALALGLVSNRSFAAEASLDKARQLYLTGKYAEAKELYELLPETDSVPAALGAARCEMATGKLDDAAKRLEKIAKENPDSAAPRAMLAELELARGNYETAQEWADFATEIDGQQTAARWVVAELHRLAGRLDEAKKAYEWFVDYYNANDKFSSDDLRYVGLAAAQFARWERNHGQFSFLVNELYPDILDQEKNYWQANLEAGRLFLEKYNQADAASEFQAALKINPNAAEVHAALAELALQNYELDQARASIDRALAINPNLLLARLLKADVELANFEPAAAEKILAEALPLCPASEKTLGRLAAVRGCLDGLGKPVPESRIGKLIDEAVGRNPHAGEFFQSLAASLDTMRRYPQASHYYREAIRVMPQLVGAYGQLGLVHMRLGEEKEARELLEKAFDVDFGNVRVKNSLEVLDVLDTYETLETDHFLIRFDPQHDKLQARYIADYLESVYPNLCQQLGYHPKEKSLFEIFNRAKNTRGHGWFSARMVGLPHIHTIGACAGKMVAMVSPADMDQKFNWARVVKHEFVHVINLQQTNFTIPHWFTEALAVYNEGYPRPQSWNDMLARRVPAGETFNLDTINLGFIRPTSSDDWQMAYCQAEMYAEYMLQRFGDEALAKMLAGYSDNLDTPATIERAFGVKKDDFETGYTEYVAKIVAGLSPGREPAKPRTFTDLEKAVKDHPDDPDALAELALQYLARKAYPKAGDLANKALKIDAKHQASVYVKARLQLLIGNTDGVVEMLDAALDRDAPQVNLLLLLAGLHYKSGKFAEAAELYQLGRDKFPSDDKWTKLLARVYIKSDQPKRLAPLLEAMAEADGDDLTIRKKLAQIAYDDKDYAAAVRWATEAIYIDVLDVELHRMLAEALVEQKQYDRAIAEYDVAIELEPQRLHLRFALADACVQAGKQGRAREVLEALLKLDPEYPGADVLLESLEKVK